MGSNPITPTLLPDRITMSTSEIVFFASAYVLLASFVMGGAWKYWGCIPSDNGTPEIGVFFYGLLWPITVSIHLSWKFGERWLTK